MITHDLPADDLRVGRYSHAELSSMRGRRGRKPPEFYQLFPELKKSEATPRLPADQARVELVPDPDDLAQRVRAASPAVRRLVEALLALPELAVASSGQPPDLTLRVPVAVLAADEALVANVAQAGQGAAAELVVTPGPEAGPISLPLRDPVYADPESEAVLGSG